MSSPRSRRGGRGRVTTLSRKKRSSRNRFALTSAWRSRLLAAMTGCSPQWSRAAQPAERTAFQYGEQLGLHVHGHFADFIQKKGALVGFLQQTRFGLNRVGEGALLLAEQLGFNQMFGQCGAVDLDEGRRSGHRAGVDDPCGRGSCRTPFPPCSMTVVDGMRLSFWMVSRTRRMACELPRIRSVACLRRKSRSRW